MTRKELESFLEAAKNTGFLSDIGRAFAELSFVVDTMPDFATLEFSSMSSFYIRHRSPTWRQSFIRDFFVLFEELGDMVENCMAHVSIADSGVSFDPAVSSDLHIAFGKDPLAPVIRMGVGRISRGLKDLDYRKTLFESFLKVAVPNGRVEIVMVDGALEVQLQEDSPLTYRDTRFDRTKYHPRQANLIGVDKTEMGRKNPLDIVLHCFTEDELPAKVAELLEIWGESKTVACNFGLRCSVSSFGSVRAILNESPFSPWHVMVGAISKYTPDDLDEMVAKHDSFLIPLFKLTPPHIGETTVLLSYDKDEFELDFEYEFRDEEQMDGICRLITDLAGGKDIIDYEASEM